MRLAFVCFESSPGGTAADLRRWLEAAAQSGHQCRLYCSNWAGPAPAGTELCTVKPRGRARHKRHASFIEQVGQALQGEPADRVVGLEPMPGLDLHVVTAGSVARQMQHKSGWSARRGGAYRHFLACEQAVFAPGAGTAILYLTPLQQQEFGALYGAAGTLLPPGVAADRRAGADAVSRRRALRAALDLAEGELLLLYAATDFERQGLERAIRALAHAREVQPHQPMRLLVAGGDRYRRHWHLARKLGVREHLQFLGWRDDLPDLLLAADLLVHPALYAPVGRILLEALVAQLPVVATSSCGYAQHIIEGRAGLVLREPYSQEDLEHAVLRMIDGVFRSQCRESGQAYVQRTQLDGQVAAIIAQVEGTGG